MGDLEWYLNKLRRKDIKDKPIGGGAYHAAKQDERLSEEHRWECKNVCPKCNMVLARNGTCPMEC